MKKTILVGFIASITYFIIYIMLKLSLQDTIIDWQNAILGALVFWFFIFLVHHYLSRANKVPW